MEFKYEETGHRPPISFTPPPPPPNVSYVQHQPLSGPNSTIEISEFIRTEMEKMKEEIMEILWSQIEKERIREEIVVDEIVRRRLLEAEVRRELRIEKELAFHRGNGLSIDPRVFQAPLSPLEVDNRSIGERFVTSLEGRFGEREGKPLGERFVTFREGRLGEGEGEGEGSPVGERFAASHDGRLRECDGRPLGERFVSSREGRLGEEEGAPVREWFATSLDGRVRELDGRPFRERFAPSLDVRLCELDGTPLVERFVSSHEGRLGEGGGRHIRERLTTSFDGRLREWEGRPLGEMFVTSRGGGLGEGDRRSIGEWFATSLGRRVGMGPQTSMETHISEPKLHLGNGKQQEKIILPAGDERLRYTREQLIQLREVPGIPNAQQVLGDSLWNCGTPSVRSREDKKNLFKFWCEMCQIGTHSEEVMESHQRGKNHLALKKSMLKYWCDVCQIGANTEHVIKMHLTGKKHLAQLHK